ncbi:MAG TPA: DNA polymerase III subunit gamma/tau [Clostridiales bacterium UBA8153]|nr:DNA polymerase III subunit gamma/tau [Clostridiales bacterium UBA8153]
MAYTALYREWRPQSFSEVVGQHHISRTLLNALKHDQVSHAYLFSGPRGTGKTTVAKLLAKAVNCLAAPGDRPCNACPACNSITAGVSVDVQEMDAASNRGIDEIRDLRDRVRYLPVEYRKKVYIIDEVHMLTEPAFNALLKTLEEPPKHVLFILATTEPHKLPATIVSRCQRFDFHRLDIKLITDRLQQVVQARGANVTPAALWTMAKASEGAMRDALSLLDQCLAMGAGVVDVGEVQGMLGQAGEDAFEDICRALVDRDLGRLVRRLEAITAAGQDWRQLTLGLSQYLRDILLVKLCGAEAPVDAHDPARLDVLGHFAQALPESQLYQALETLAGVEEAIRRTGRGRLLLELALIKLAAPVFPGEGVPVPPPEVAQDREVPKAPIPTGGTPPRETPPSVRPARDDLQCKWEAVMDRLKKSRQMSVHATLQPVRVAWGEDENLQLVYAREYDFHKSRMEQDAACHRVLEAALREVFGRPVTFKISGEEGMQAPAGSCDPKADPVVKLALELFDGEIIKGT